MRLLHVADVHFDRTSRWEETLRLTQEIVEIAEREAVGLITIGGDIFERQSTPEERNAVAAWLEDLATFAPVVGVYGNHDSALDLDIFQRIEAKHRIIFAARPAVHVVAGTAVACLPWPPKAPLPRPARPPRGRGGDRRGRERARGRRPAWARRAARRARWAARAARARD